MTPYTLSNYPTFEELTQYRPNRDELQAARHLMFQYGQPGGWEPGSFSNKLIGALECADVSNRIRLLTAFPEYRWAVIVCTTLGANVLADLVWQAAEEVRG